MSVLVEKVMMSKSGKALRVLLGPNGTIWYNAALNSGLNGMTGKMIEAEIETHEKFGPGIKDWKPSAVSTGYIPPAVPVVPAVHGVHDVKLPQYAEPGKPGTTAPYWLPMASNVVAHAIANGLVKDPNSVAGWVRAVKLAVENDDSGEPPF